MQAKYNRFNKLIKKIRLLFFLIIIILPSGCSFFLITSTVIIISGTSVLLLSDQKIKESFLDTEINNRFKLEIFKNNFAYLKNISATVHNSSVLLTGRVEKEEEKEKIEKLAREINGVTEVYNYLENSKMKSLIDFSWDCKITSEIKSKLLIAKNIKSLNFKIKTYGGAVYILGTANSNSEILSILSIIQKISGVKKIFNLAILVS